MKPFFHMHRDGIIVERRAEVLSELPVLPLLCWWCCEATLKAPYQATGLVLPTSKFALLTTTPAPLPHLLHSSLGASRRNRLQRHSIAWKIKWACFWKARYVVGVYQGQATCLYNSSLVEDDLALLEEDSRIIVYSPNLSSCQKAWRFYPSTDHRFPFVYCDL